MSPIEIIWSSGVIKSRAKNTIRSRLNEHQGKGITFRISLSKRKNDLN